MTEYRCLTEAMALGRSRKKAVEHVQTTGHRVVGRRIVTEVVQGEGLGGLF